MFELPKLLMYISYSFTGGISNRSNEDTSNSMICCSSTPLRRALLATLSLNVRCLADTKLMNVLFPAVLGLVY